MIHLGSYLDTLGDATWDALICDPPYSARTHTGHNSSVSGPERLAQRIAAIREGRAKTKNKTLQHLEADLRRAQARGITHRAIPYASWGVREINAFIRFTAPRTRGWMVDLCDHRQIAAYTRAMQRAGRYVFSPLVWDSPGSRIRMTGDGPACWVCYIIVSRPRGKEWLGWGSLPGSYIGPQDRASGNGIAAHVGGKPMWLMQQLVTHYSRPGDVVCDPCAGYGTTLDAARSQGRLWLGSEMDPDTHAIAAARLALPPPPPLLASMRQGDLIGDTP